MDKSQKITLISNIILVGFAIAIGFHYILGFYFNFGEPYNTFLSDKWFVLGDYKFTLMFITDFAPYSKPDFWVNYFPLAYIFLYPFSQIKNLYLSYFFYSLIFLIPFIWINIKLLSCDNESKLQNFQNIFIITLLSFPFLAIVEDGNIDMFLMVLLSVFIFLFYKKKFLLSSIVLAIANAMKPFFLVFLLLFLFEKKWKDFFLNLLLTFLLIISGFMILNGGFWEQINTYIINLKIFQQTYVANVNVSFFGHLDLFTLLKMVFCHSYKLIDIKTLISFYNLFIIFMTVVLSFFVAKEKVFWKKMALFVCYLLVVPYIIFDYKLIFLFLPLWGFLNTSEKSRFDSVYSFLFGLLFIPKRFLPVVSGAKLSLFHLSSILNPLLILFFMGLIMFEHFLEKKEKKIEL